MNTAERSRRHICLSVTDAQAEAIVALRMVRADPTLSFSRWRYSDGKRAVLNSWGTPVAVIEPGGLVAGWDGRE